MKCPTTVCSTCGLRPDYHEHPCLPLEWVHGGSAPSTVHTCETQMTQSKTFGTWSCSSCNYLADADGTRSIFDDVDL